MTYTEIKAKILNVLSEPDSALANIDGVLSDIEKDYNEKVQAAKAEADALYAGIVIDTDGFNSKSGPRTFEVAAYLKKFGISKSTVHKDVTLQNGRKIGQVIPESIEIKKVFLAEKNPVVRLGLVIK